MESSTSEEISYLQQGSAAGRSCLQDGLDGSHLLQNSKLHDSHLQKGSMLNGSYLPQKSELEGKITFITGPMFAGKSNAILTLTEQFESVEAYKSALHKRDGNFIRSRTGKSIACQLLDDMTQSTQNQAEVTIIDEYQFIPIEQLKEIVENFKRQKRTLIIAGLRKMDRTKYWSNYKYLKKQSDILIKLKAKCEICEQPAKYIYTNQDGTPRALARKAKFGTVREPRCDRCYGLNL